MTQRNWTQITPDEHRAKADRYERNAHDCEASGKNVAAKAWRDLAQTERAIANDKALMAAHKDSDDSYKASLRDGRD